MENWFALIPSTFNSSYGFNIFLDCCDGSDEYDGSVHCANTCIMGGNTEYMTSSYISTSLDISSIDVKQTKSEVYMEDLIQKLKGILLFLEKKKKRYSSVYCIFYALGKCILIHIGWGFVIPGLKVLIILQVALIGLAVIFRIFHRRARSKIRRYR